MKDIPDYVLSTVVRLIVHKTHADADTPYAVSTGSTATGTGFFIDTYGHILTCAHVIADASQVEVEIPSKGNLRFKATLLGICPVFDLGMVRIVNYSYSNACSLDEHAWDTVQSGDAVTAVGFPLKMSHQKQTKGVVVGREMNKYQTDVVILSGNSGGPLFKDSRVIGVNSNSPAREDVEDAVIGYAVPIARYYLVADMLKQPGRVIRFPTDLGVGLQNTYAEWRTYVEQSRSSTKKRSRVGHRTVSRSKTTKSANTYSGGMAITTTNGPKGLLGSAGLQSGDVLLQINGWNIDSSGNLSAMWMRQPLSIDEAVLTFRLGDWIPYVYWSVSRRKVVTRRFRMREYTPGVRLRYPAFEQDDYEVVAGMVVGALTLNHVLDQWTVGAFGTEWTSARTVSDPRYQPFLTHASHCNRPRVALLAVLTSSYLASQHLFPVHGTHLIDRVNGHRVHTMEEFRKAIVQPMKRNGATYFEILTDDKTLVVLPLSVVSKEESRLRQMHQYPVSTLQIPGYT